MKLWLDDVRPAPKGWVWARTNEAAKQYLKTGRVDECSLDHDLGYHGINVDQITDPDELIEAMQLRGQSEETGLQLIHWMLEKHLVPSHVRIHSWNPDGARYMAAALNHRGYDCVISPFKIGEAA